MAIIILAIDWVSVLERYGFPTLALFVIITFGVYVTKKALIPFFTDYVKQAKDEAAKARVTAEAASDKVQEMLENQLKKAEAASQRAQLLEDTVFEGIKEALTNSVRRQDKQIELMSQVLITSQETNKVVKDTNDLARGRIRT
jgi:hypothetical protein